MKKLKNFLILICIAGLAILCSKKGENKQADNNQEIGTILEDSSPESLKIAIENWTMEIIARSTTEDVPSYVSQQDSEESGSIIEIVTSPYINGLSSLVLIQKGEGRAIGFVAGNISSPGNILIVVEFQIHNRDTSSTPLRIGDLSFASKKGQHLPFVTVAKGESYLIAKNTDIALKSAQEETILFNPDERIKITYCFIVSPESFPIRFMLKNKKTKCILNQDDVPKYETDIYSSYMGMELAGQFNLIPLDDIKLEGNLMSLDTDVQFEAEGITFPVEEFPEGAPFAVYMGGHGARSLNTMHITERINGEQSAQTLSQFYVFKNGLFLSGAITMLESFSPFEVTTEMGKQRLQVTFKSDFQSQKGDKIAALGQVGLGASVLSVRVMD